MEKKKGLVVKDYIFIGVFTALFFVILTIISFLMEMVPVLFPFVVGGAGLVGAPIYMLMLAKVQKRGAILLSGVLIALLYLMTGGFPITLVGILFAGVVGELIASLSKNRNLSLLAIAYMAVMTICSVAVYAPAYLMTELYFDNVAKYYPQDYTDRLQALFTWPVGLGIVVSTALLTWLGVLLSRRLMRKHFLRAGLISPAPAECMTSQSKAQ